MRGRERILRTFRFEQTDRPGVDLMEGHVWKELMDWFRAEGMDPESIARDFGGRMVFYGGLDVQNLLSFGSRDDVAREVRRNVSAFEHCGGYVVANSHHGEQSINGGNIVAMFEAACALGASGSPGVSGDRA